ncbi:MAG TPA: heme-binding protein [Lacipirellulaceae bacterium]|nr:heme-binding protein [Lacipirellulaceae bacterium]
MNVAFSLLVIALLLVRSTYALEPQAERVDVQPPLNAQKVAGLGRIKEIEKRFSIDASIERLNQDVSDLLPMVKENVIATELLTTALVIDSEAAAQTLKNALSEAREVLAFRPIAEAPVPDGFPGWTPVGEIRVNTYPAHRVARVKLKDDETSGFWTLFRHIETNEVAMTAPVRMTYAGELGERPRSTAMAFLYQSTEIGETGEQGDVEVVDVASELALSIGMRGEVTADTVKKGAAFLKSWLADHADEIEAAGSWRVFGYNSPFVPVNQRYFEVQLPVRKK